MLLSSPGVNRIGRTPASRRVGTLYESVPEYPLPGGLARLLDWGALGSVMSKKHGLSGATPEQLLGAWPQLVQKLSDSAQVEATKLLKASETMGVLALGDYIEKTPPGPLTIAWLVKLARAQQRSKVASHAASMKNLAAREYVARAWQNYTDREQGKASFARMIAHEVKRRFGVEVTADRIARTWLVGP